jgi:3-oxoacyl-[acyl-carrier-protein] synthase-3
MGYKAALKAVEMANWDIKTIDLIILATSTPHDLFGSAPSIQAKLGADNAVAFDLTAACSGFLFALITASQFIKGSSFKRAIVIGADQLSSFVDWNDRRSCILFGDGAGALAIEASNQFDNFIDFDMRTDGERGSFLNLPSINNKNSIIDDINFASGGFSPIQMNGQEVYKFAVREVPIILGNLFRKTDYSSEEVDWLLLHQANQRILDSVGERLKIPREKILSNLGKYGNTSAATIPLMMDEGIRNNKIKQNDIIAVSGFGAGLSWGAALIKWG